MDNNREEILAGIRFELFRVHPTDLYIKPLQETEAKPIFRNDDYHSATTENLNHPEAKKLADLAIFD